MLSMLRLFSLTTTFVVLLSSCSNAIVNIHNFASSEAQDWAQVTAARLVACYFDNSTGLFTNQLDGQSSSTLETIASFVSLQDSPQRYIFDITFRNTDPFTGDHCYDDLQMWLLTWIQVYKVDPNIKYLQRAAAIHDLISNNAWISTTCGGGLRQCPSYDYKNAITNELFLTSSMHLHPYAKLLGKPSRYYLQWALREWRWLENSRMINKNYLINDGLSPIGQSPTKGRSSINADTCVNNNGTTWTYNQGVILSGLALLYNATRNSTLINIAQKIADATMRYLTYTNGILKEPCEPDCTNDQKIYKGIFARHLGYLLPFLTDELHIQKYSVFLRLNAMSLWTTSRCATDGLLNLLWDTRSPDACNSVRDTATTSAALDAFISTAKSTRSTVKRTSKWMIIGLGNCIDDRNHTMPNFYQNAISEESCRETAENDKGAVAYDYQISCTGWGFCRIRTLSSQSHTPPGFDYESGVARRVTATNQVTIANCYMRIY